jgi:RecB family endonuclease NucS
MRAPSKTMTLSNPSVDEANALVEKALSQRWTLILVGNCIVHYAGRAKSTLGAGERILIVKEDGAILVHRPLGYEPVNWQPSGCIIHTRKENSVLEVKAIRRKPLEHVRVTFTSIYLAAAFSLKDSAGFVLNASEEDMQRAILLKPSLLEEGFKPISYEKKVEPGFVDVYGEDEKGRLVVVEIKRKTAGKEAVLQLAKYIEAIKSKINREVRGVLAAPNLAKDAHRLLETLNLQYKTLSPTKCAETLRKDLDKKLEEFIN